MHCGSDSTFTVYSDNSAILHVSQLPPNPAILAPGPALLFVVVNGVPSNGSWIMVGSGTLGVQAVAPAQILPASIGGDGGKVNAGNAVITMTSVAPTSGATGTAAMGSGNGAGTGVGTGMGAAATATGTTKKSAGSREVSMSLTGAILALLGVLSFMTL